jgi:hypothetical protein
MNKDQFKKLQGKLAKKDAAVRKLMRKAPDAMRRAGLLPEEAPAWIRPRPRIMLLVPSYRTPHAMMLERIAAAIDYASRWVEVFSPPRTASSVIHWARNTALAAPWVMGEAFDYVLYCDDDMAMAPDTILKLWLAQKDIVAALATRRVDPPIPNIFMLDKNLEFQTILKWKTEGLMQVDGAGTGMMLISRRALEQVGEYYLRCGWERQIFGRRFNRALENAFGTIACANADEFDLLRKFSAMAADEFEQQMYLEEHERREAFRRTGDAHWFQFLPKLNGRGEYGEDLSFCLKAKMCNVDVFTDTRLQIGHIGDYAYSIEDFLPYRDAMMAIEEKEVPTEDPKQIVLAE